MKYLIVGLGNPGSEYYNTRHNAGFMVLDALARASSTVFSSMRLGDVAKMTYRGRTLLLLKPSTFMNLSGRSVQYWLQKENIPIEKLLVIVDDIALPLGTLRLRAKGSNGGHNGLKDIEARLQTSAYPRMRVGIGNNFNPGRQIDYVLTPFNDEELKVLTPTLDEAARAIQLFCTIGLTRTMNDINTAHPLKTSEKKSNNES